jgi:FkbM family methyltransferase
MGQNNEQKYQDLVVFMKDLIKRILGPKGRSRLRTWFPSGVQKRAEIQEIARKATFYGSFVKTGSVCFDVGANMGNRITPFLELGAKVIAVEPQDKCFRHLKRKFGDKIVLVKKGLGEADGIKKFHISEDSTLSSFSDNWMSSVTGTDRFKGRSWIKTVKAVMTTADELIKQYGKPDFIKIDVEGYELEVLKGLTQPIRMISFEYTVPEQPDRASMCLDEIEKHNPQIECNYSIGEDLVWAMSEWVSASKMRALILSEAFQKTSFGDIYVRARTDGELR